MSFSLNFYPMLTHLLSLFDRDLALVAREIDLYAGDEALWKLAPGIANSGGTLVLHLCGNLRHYIGFQLGGIPYRRDRPAEFSLRDVPRAELHALLDLARQAVATLAQLDPERLKETYPEEVLGWPLTVEFFLIHLYGHLRYHTGQVNYHRRLVA